MRPSTKRIKHLIEEKIKELALEIYDEYPEDLTAEQVEELIEQASGEIYYQEDYWMEDR